MAGAGKQVLKKSTGLTGLYVCQHPYEELTAAYRRLLKALQVIPEGVPYRQNTEKLVRERFALVESERDPVKLEEKIGMGQIEEVLEQAQCETNLAKTMAKYRPWEPLVEKEPEGQWRWPP